jgi:hypothetical protein
MKVARFERAVNVGFRQKRRNLGGRKCCDRFLAALAVNRSLAAAHPNNRNGVRFDIYFRAAYFI